MSPLGKNLLLLVFGLAITATSGKAVAAEPPNIIVVNVDDIGPAWLPPYARKLTPADIEQKTANEYGIMHKDEGTLDLAKHLEAARHSMPFVDSLAQNGMVFDRCFATSSLCAPSRSALLTGCYQQRWGAFSIPDVFAIGIPKDVPVLAENFQAAVYDCGIVGKWHVAEHDPALAGGDKKTNGYTTSSAPGQGPLDRGFNYYFGYNNSGSHYYEADDLWDGKQRVPKRPAGEFLTDFLSSKCVDFVSQAVAKKQRFLLYFAPMSLHGALRPPPEKYSSQFHTGMKFSDQYAGHLLALDEGIRKIFDVLKASGQDQNTLFILSADNGQSKYRVPPYNAPYRGGKGTGWLGGTHEPLIISWPAQLHAGWHHELVSTMDIFATALDAAGLAPTKPIDGRSLLPLMRGQTKTGPHDELFSAGLHSTYFSDSYFPGDTEEIDRGHADVSDEKKCPLYAWRQDSDTVLTYITKIQPGLYPEFPQGRSEQRLYYNLKTDPQEDSNLFSDTPEVEKASGDLGDWLRTTKAPIIEHAENYKQLFQMAPPSSNKVP